MKKTASIEIVRTGEVWTIGRVNGCSHGTVTHTVPNNQPGMPKGSTRSEAGPCNCGGA